MQNEIARIQKALAKATDEDKEYADSLLTWLADWLERGGEPSTQSDPGDHPPPPPPHP